ncbi:MAG: winged helix-turn-helix transcriptional regulator [Massilia sp.]
MSKGTRSYNQYCPLARTLDVLGERWTLLIVRELLSGPKRFKDLQDALVGIGTNLLSARLKEVERNGLVTRAKLPPPGVASVYELTEHGRKLDETLLSLIRWGIPLLAAPKRPEENFQPHWMLHGMLSTFKPSLAKGLVATFEFQVDHEVFHTHVQDGHASGDMGKGHAPCLVWSSDSETFMALVFQMMTPQEAFERGYVKVGSVEQLELVLRLFAPMTVPAPQEVES